MNNGFFIGPFPVFAHLWIPPINVNE